MCRVLMHGKVKHWIVLHNKTPISLCSIGLLNNSRKFTGKYSPKLTLGSQVLVYTPVKCLTFSQF